MSSSATFLHLTDTHLALAGVPFVRDDHKITIPAIEGETRESALELLFTRLAERLSRGRQQLDGVLFTGDAQERGQPGGHKIILDLLLHHFEPLGITTANIVAIPGNHDVPRASEPSSAARYDAFIEVWRKAGCVTPWLDGVDASDGEGGPHRLVSNDGRWAVFPINTSNWSHATQILPEPLASVWAGLPSIAADGNGEMEAKLRLQLDALARYDMARVSGRQLEVLRKIIEETPLPSSGRQVRIALLHHHLRTPSLREELKPFADISNLEQVRSFLRDRDIAVVVHGHKHEHSVQFEHIYDRDGNKENRILVVSGATFEAGSESDAARLIAFTGMPNSPTVSIERVRIPRSGVELVDLPPIVRRIWTADVVQGGPVVIQGNSLDEVYERACEAAAKEAANGTLIVHLDLELGVSGNLPLPTDYPTSEPMDESERQRWLKDLVTWWQLDRSGLEDRMPFVHGARLRRFGGKINQVERVIKLLETKASTRAIAVLIDPFRDFTADGMGEEFASFCLVEFKRRDLGNARHAVDVIAFYRAQEFARWWPINVAEMRYLQWEICNALRFQPGRITTITGDARTHSRSPTQVAMPIIDRWLDQSPERFHLLANTLVHRSARNVAQRDAMRGWERTLRDLEATANEFNPDGLPIAIEGLKLLASYLEVVDEGEDQDLRMFVRVLRRLARDNEGFEKSSRSKNDFDRWAPSALDAVSELRSLTKKRVQSP
ncbi:metallophosphoesterase [Burkholderia sp. AU45388]|uniref:metallophosphoesterase n=1 Tax=Burkholderia sp. AU45388 TaxID=3059206 RepID=UPI0026560045|nr:metallophosphoesterase [Burkholderia sp. AU45388]MDN7427943.1 metallophosphoesterase [Burkholderia sp. AU45388]